MAGGSLRADAQVRTDAHLARFVTRGQHETALYFDAAAGRALGEAEPGERYYQNICAPCHGFAGKALGFSGDPNDP